MPPARGMFDALCLLAAGFLLLLPGFLSDGAAVLLLLPPVRALLFRWATNRLVELSAHEQQERTLFWMNENNPTFLLAEPPGNAGEPRFEVEFFIDANKRLTLTARDLLKGSLVLNQSPVVKLT